MLDTHNLLVKTGYSSEKNYGDIAKYAAKIRHLSKKEVLSSVKKEFGPVTKRKSMLSKPKDLVMFGKPCVDFELSAVEQIKTSLSLPVSNRGALMPDAHLGYAMPIGGVVSLNNAVSPSFVGYDIACRVTMTVLDISPKDFAKNRDSLAQTMLNVSSFGKGSGFNNGNRRDHSVMENSLWRELHHVKQLHALAWQQLGSSGGGNHFFDAVIGKVVNNVSWLPLKKDDEFCAIITHSGSRGAGYKLAKHYMDLAKKETSLIAKVPPGYEWLDTRSDKGREYLSVMEFMGLYAQANHHIIHELFLKQTKINEIAQYENHHNFAWIEGDKVIHRKGATPASKGIPGIIPGTSGTASYLVNGLGNKKSLESSSHGAGRLFSRTEAKKRHDPSFVRTWMKNNDILEFGVAADESLLAYKDIEHVMKLQKDLVEPVAKMWPKIVVMGN